MIMIFTLISFLLLYSNMRLLIWLIKQSETAMAPHCSTLAWNIPWTEEPGGLRSMRSLRVGHDRATSLSLFTFMHWRRKWQPTPVFLPGESQGRGSLVGCCLWGLRVGHDWNDLAAAALNSKYSILVNCSPVSSETGQRQWKWSLNHLWLWRKAVFVFTGNYTILPSYFQR